MIIYTNEGNPLGLKLLICARLGKATAVTLKKVTLSGKCCIVASAINKSFCPWLHTTFDTIFFIFILIRSRSAGSQAFATPWAGFGESSLFQRCGRQVSFPEFSNWNCRIHWSVARMVDHTFSTCFSSQYGRWSSGRSECPANLKPIGKNSKSDATEESISYGASPNKCGHCRMVTSVTGRYLEGSSRHWQSAHLVSNHLSATRS